MSGRSEADQPDARAAFSLTDALSEIVAPVVRAVFNEGEVSQISVQFEPHLHGGSITLSLLALG